MATISKRGAGWFVQVRRKGYPAEYKTLPTKAEALAWARQRERRVDANEPVVDRRLLSATTLGDVLRRYLVEVTPSKRGADSERLRLGKMLRAPVCELSLLDLNSGAIAAYRDMRLASVKPATVRRELSLFRHALNVAQCEWGFSLPRNPVELVKRPPARDARDRRLRPGDMEKLEPALRRTRSPIVGQVVHFAIATGLRRSEILSLDWVHVELVLRTAHIPVTKTGNPRTIPLTDDALAILRERSTHGADGRVFPITPVAFRLAWERVRNRAGLRDLRFHDLRHEAISRFCELGLSIPEVAVISGHRDPRMLFRYAHLRPADLARKLAGRSWSLERRGLA